MIHASWALAAFVLGGSIGVFLMAVMSIAKESDNDNEG